MGEAAGCCYVRAMLFKSEEINVDLGVLVLRIGAGGTMLWQHGWPKLVHFTDKMDHFADPIGLGPEAYEAVRTRLLKLIPARVKEMLQT